MPLATVIKKYVRGRFSSRGEKIQIVDNTLGYELRCAPPIPFDCEYVRDLGYSAVRYLLDEAKNTPGESGGLVCRMGQDRFNIPFSELMDTNEKKIKIKLVDIKSQGYEVAYKYMIRLKKEDFQPNKLPYLARVAGMKQDEFKETFGKLIDPITGETLIPQ